MRLTWHPPVFVGLFYLLLLIYMGVILNMPLFPSQDGPLHLYYTDVVANLWRGTDAHAGFFTIRHILPPYSLHTYVLLALNTLFSPITSEKILICFYLLILCCGFRYLLFSVWKQADAASLFVFPFALHKLAYMGFYNFILGTGIALWVGGFWARYHDDLSGWRSLIFLLLIGLLLVTHPIALLLSLVFIAIHISVSILIQARELTGRWFARYQHSLRRHKRQLAYFALASCSLFYIGLFTVPDAVTQPIFQAQRIGWQALKLLLLLPVSPFTTPSYDIVLIAIVALAVALTVRALWQRRTTLRIEYGDALLFFSALCALGYLFAPRWINKSAYFDERFPIFSVLFLLASAAAFRLSGLSRVLLGTTLFAASCWLLYAQTEYTKDFIEKIQVMGQAPAMQGTVRGAILMEKTLSQPWPWPRPRPLSFDPTLWAAAHYFRRSHAVLLNGAWLNQSHMMLNTAEQPPLNAEPYKMTGYLTRDENLAALHGVDLLIVVNLEQYTVESPRTPAIAQRYGLTQMPWSNRTFTFYARPESAPRVDSTAE